MRIWQVPNPVPANTGELIGQAAPLADLSDWLMDPIERALFAVIQWLATGFWNLDRAFLNAAVQIYAWRNAITEPSGLIARLVQSLTTDPTLRNLIGGAFLLALLIVALLFGLRFLGSQQFDLVDIRKIAAWMLLIGVLLTQGPQLVADLESSRAGMSSAAYQIAAAVNQGMNYQNSEMPNGTPGAMGPLTHIFTNTTQLGPGELDGIDVSAAYLFAMQEDINGTTNAGGGLPPQVQQQYFTTCVGGTCASPWPDNGMSEQARQQALAKAMDGLIRMFTGGVPSLFAIEQSLVYLTLAVSAAILITALLVTVMFAFFRPTEALPIGIMQNYVRLFILTYLVTLLLDVLMGFLVYWAGSDNWVAFLGAAALVVVVTLQPVFLGFGTIRHALAVALGGQNPTPFNSGALAGGAVLAAARAFQHSRDTGPESEAAPPPDALPPPSARPGGPAGEPAARELERNRRPTERLNGQTPPSLRLAPTDRLGYLPNGTPYASNAAPTTLVAPETGNAGDANRQQMNQYLESQGIPPIRSLPRHATPPAPPASPADAPAGATSPAATPAPGATTGPDPNASAMPGSGTRPTSSRPAPTPAAAATTEPAGPATAPAGPSTGPGAEEASPASLVPAAPPDNVPDAPVSAGARPALPEMRPPGRLGAAAAELAARGWAVFPLGQRSKVPLKGSGGFRDATTDPTQIGSWWTQGAYNVGIATGQASGILVVDVDTHGADGRPFIAAHPDLLPPTATVETPTGGQHRYYRLPAGVGAPCTQGDRGGLAPGVDTRGDGGYIVAPPSIHPQGGQYRWAPGASPAERELAVAPPELLARLQPAPPVLTTPAVVSSSSTGASSPLLAPGSRPAPEVLLDWGLRQAQIGSRDNTGFRLARQVLANGYDGGEGEAIMLQYADRVPQTADDPYTHADALRNWESAHRYPILEPWARGGANGVEARATESQVPAAE